jgi:hypothetical protein
MDLVSVVFSEVFVEFAAALLVAIVIAGSFFSLARLM